MPFGSWPLLVTLVQRLFRGILIEKPWCPCMEALVIRDTFDSLASTTPPLHLDAWHLDALTTQLTLAGDVDAGPGALSGLPVSDAAGPQSLWSQAGGSALGTVARRAAPAGAEVLLCNGRCTRRIFTERLAPLVAPWARRTQRLTQWLVHIAVALAGTAGARLSRGLGLAVSRKRSCAYSVASPSQMWPPPGARRRRLGRSERSEVWERC